MAPIEPNKLHLFFSDFIRTPICVTVQQLPIFLILLASAGMMAVRFARKDFLTYFSHDIFSFNQVKTLEPLGQ